MSTKRRRVRHRGFTREKRRQKEFIAFLKWLEEGPRPWMETHIRNWRECFMDRGYRAARGQGGALGPFLYGPNESEARIYALKRAFYYAQRLRYTEIRKRGGRIMIALTDRGRARLFHVSIRDASELPSPWVLVIFFDIPEQERRARNKLRQFLKECGFQQLQLSVWYTTRDCEQQLRIFISSLEVEPWVNIMRAQYPELRNR